MKPKRMVSYGRKILGTSLFITTLMLHTLNAYTKQSVDELSKQKKESSVKEVINGEMEKYFPLAVGNTWEYKRTVRENVIFSYAAQTIVEGEWATFLISSFLDYPNMSPNVSKETYTITGKTGEAFFKIKIDGGVIQRDGRYYNQPEGSIRWGYVEDGVSELISGEVLFQEGENQRWIAILKPNIIISPRNKKGESPPWEIGTELLKEKIRVPAGTFSNCLKNCTMVNGENLADVLLKNAAPVYSEREGEKCFRTESFYVKDIGLVKEVQYNAKNKVTYQLELIEYKTNK